ncbi:hypothetical protein BHE74_00013610 [Ensete ventricosum]|nr:hypothetical protein BHE74_00013610 [Ensete ventricosum]
MPRSKTTSGRYPRWLLIYASSGSFQSQPQPQPHHTPKINAVTAQRTAPVPSGAPRVQLVAIIGESRWGVGRSGGRHASFSPRVGP